MFRRIMNVFVSDPSHYAVQITPKPAEPEELSPEEIEAQRVIAEKRQAAIDYLGEKWIMHPKHVRGMLDDRKPRVLDQVGR